MNYLGRCLLAGILLVSLTVSWAHAGGLYLYELGNPEVGLAAAGWAARAQDAATVYTNPAGMTRLERSELMVGIQPLYLHTKFSPDAATSTSGSDGDASTWLPAAGLYYVHGLTPKLKIGVGSLGYFGLGLDYGDDWVGRYYVQEVTLQALGLQPAVAYQVTEWLSLGAGVVALYAVLDQKVAINNLQPGLPDGRLEIEDRKWAFQANLGILVEPRKGTRLGLTYLSKADLDFADNPQFSGLGPGLEAILRDRGLLNSELQVGFTMPQALMFSVYHDLNDRWAVMGNLGWQDWSEFGMVGIGVVSSNVTSLTVDRNYKDTWHVALGGQYRLSEPWLLTAGVSYDSSLMDDEDRTPDLPLGEAWRFGLGARYDWSQDMALGLAYEFLWGGDLDMDVDRGVLAGNVSGTYENTSMHFINFYLQWKF